MQTLKNAFVNPDDVNLLGVFNFYYELNNLIKGVTRTSYIEDVVKNKGDVEKIFNSLQNIIDIDFEEYKENMISYNNAMKIQI